jgi:branched-chain amino acid transport system substrate-binding protein
MMGPPVDIVEANIPRKPECMPAGPGAKAASLKIVSDKSYPPTTGVHAHRARHPDDPDLVFVVSYPPDTVGMVRAANEVG